MKRTSSHGRTGQPRNDQGRHDQGRGEPRRNDQRRRQRSAAQGPVDLWRTPGPLPPMTPIVPADDPGALLRSLGEAPLPGGTEVSPYFQSAVERSAGMATALALTLDLLARPATDQG